MEVTWSLWSSDAGFGGKYSGAKEAWKAPRKSPTRISRNKAEHCRSVNHQGRPVVGG